MKYVVVLGLCLAIFGASQLFMACADIPAGAARRAQAEAARAGQEVACAKHVRRLLELRDQGVSCDRGKEMAATENPLCNLSFTCPARDGSADVQDGGVE